MAAIVCHGLQSCLDSQLVESRIHRLMLPPSKLLTPHNTKLLTPPSNTKPHCEENSYKADTLHHNPISSNPNQGGWSFLQALSNVSQCPKDKETTYVHPQVKQSSMRLSPKSLELCTENLGNETGTDIIDIENGYGIDLVSSSWDCAGTREQRKSGQLLGAKKTKTQTQNFPPPLTTIRGSDSLRMRPHREGGRLVIEVIKVPSCFQAKRSHGRLRLCFLKNPTSSFDPEEDDDNEGFEEELESEMNGQRQDVDVEEEEAEENEEETDEEAEQESVENEDGESQRDTCGNNWSIGGGMRMEKYERGSRSRSRCKEGDLENNELLINWGEPLWVATS